jgi:glyoxylase-like metal-dependent hydrolase (beta-lactamase superfamily II)
MLQTDRRPGTKGVAANRRGVLKGLSCAAAGVLAGPGVGRAYAAGAPQRFNLGAMRLTVLSDGNFTGPLSFLLPLADRREVDALLPSQNLATGSIDLMTNVVVVENGPDTVLIDAGGGNQFIPTLGKLPDRLAEAGIDREKITKVVFTHAHPDHLWGVIDDFDEPMQFPKATYVLGSAEWDFWINRETVGRMPDGFKGMAAGSLRRLKIIENRTDRRKAGEELAPGITYVDTAGHTPGHMSVLLTSGQDRLLVGGDSLVHAIVSFQKPGWRWGSDLDPDKGVATRQRLLDMLATDRIDLLAYHLPYPGKGHVERKDGSYRFVAA